MNCLNKMILMGALCLTMQGLHADSQGGPRYEGESYISNEGLYYNNSWSNYVKEDEAQWDRALHRGDRYPSITTYSPDYNPQNAYKDLPAYRGDNQQSQQSCPNCYKGYQNGNARYQQQYGQYPQQQQRSENEGYNNQGYNQTTNAFRGHTGNKEHPDNDIAQNIRSELSHDTSLSNEAKSIQIDVNNGKVTLTGQVKNNGEVTKIEALVHQTDGVIGIDNNLSVK